MRLNGPTWLSDEGECVICGKVTRKGLPYEPPPWAKPIEDAGPTFMDDVCWWRTERPWALSLLARGCIDEGDSA